MRADPGITPPVGMGFRPSPPPLSVPDPPAIVGVAVLGQLHLPLPPLDPDLEGDDRPRETQDEGVAFDLPARDALGRLEALHQPFDHRQWIREEVAGSGGVDGRVGDEDSQPASATTVNIRMNNEDEVLRMEGLDTCG